jgi:multiple sugar transport system substrate-binding protein
MSANVVSRRTFLRAVAGGVVLAGGTACRADKSKRAARDSTGAVAAKNPRTLRIGQWSNYVAGYDRWFDDIYTKAWGERNGIEVVVDHFDINQAPAHAEAEVASRRGHDIFHFNLASPARFEDDVIDHRDIVEEVEAKVGKMTPFVERSVVNPKTKKYFGFSDFWAPNPAHYRSDLWEPTGHRPSSWEDVLAGGSRLKAQGHPIGIGLGGDPESNLNLLGLLHGFGASLQDEEAHLVINSPGTVEAVKVGAALFRAAMTDEVLGWEISSNNRFLISGRGSLILNAIPAIRAVEDQDPDLAEKIQLLPFPEGPGGRLSPYAVSTYVVWKFSENQEAAQRFLVDLATDYREIFIQSRYDQVPSFPGSVRDFGELVATDSRAKPTDRYRLLSGATAWMTNLGYPGHTNAATDEVVKTSLISHMFAAAARGEMSAEDAVKAAEEKIKPIYAKWREQGKI